MTNDHPGQIMPAIIFTFSGHRECCDLLRFLNKDAYHFMNNTCLLAPTVWRKAKVIS